MANKRQRLARKRFVLTTSTDSSHPPKFSDTDSAAHTISKKRKRVQLPSNDLKPENSKSNKLRKHPLRVPGKKPGEGCFICKAVDHISKNCPQRLEKDRKKVCLLCRGVGHTLKNCKGQQYAQETKFCYNCGDVGHRLAECKEPIKDGGTAFAECFVCKQKGHLSKNCPSNTHGIYPKGGSCKVCGGVTHLAKDCPQKHTGKPTNSGSGRVKLQISKEVAPASQSSNNSKRIVFRSGDELEDDFVGIGNDQDTDSKTEVDEKSSHATTKQMEYQDKNKKKGQAGLSPLGPAVKKAGKGTPKVVNFFK